MKYNILAKFAKEFGTKMSRISEETATSICKAFEASSVVGIVSHINPDGDALGSCIALRSFLSDILHKEAFIALQDDYPDTFSFLCRDERIVHTLQPCDLVVCVDVSGLDRTGTMAEPVASASAVKIIIDHHKNPEISDFDIVLSDTDVSSTCELLYDLLKMMPQIASNPASMPEKCRIALMTGMTTDTNNFANSVFSGTLKMASELLATGVDRDLIIDNVLNSYRENRLSALGYLLDKSLVINPLGFAYIILDTDTQKRFDIRDGETEGFVNIPLSVKKVRLSAFLKEDNGFFRVSLRSKNGISARELAVSKFHGGGHEQASGGRIIIGSDISDPSEASKFVENVLSTYMRTRHD